MTIVNRSYVDQYQDIHATGRYGASSTKIKNVVQLCLLEISPTVILDYGCGQSLLYRELNPNGDRKVYRYDPAIPDIADMPIEKADLVINTDVMEHIPKQDTDDVLAHIASLSKFVFFNIATCKAKRILPTGENAHCNVKDAEWWNNKVSQHFENTTVVYVRNDICGIVTWQTKAPDVYGDILDMARDYRKLKKQAEKQLPFFIKIPKKLFRSIKKRI